MVDTKTVKLGYQSGLFLSLAIVTACVFVLQQNSHGGSLQSRPAIKPVKQASIPDCNYRVMSTVHDRLGRDVVDLLILCKTAVRYYRRRSSMRQLLHSELRRIGDKANQVSAFNVARRAVRFLFVLGTKNVSAETKEKLRSECARHNDMLLGDFVDNYETLTRKTLWSLNWAVRRTRFKYILLIDDDTYLDAPALARQLDKLPAHGLYAGGAKVHFGTAVVRDPNSRWYVSKEEYAPSRFPPYHIGMAILLSHDVVQKCLPLTANVTFFGVEDAYLGVLLHRCGVRPVRAVGFYKQRNRCQGVKNPVIVGNLGPRRLTRCAKEYAQTGQCRCPA